MAQRYTVTTDYSVTEENGKWVLAEDYEKEISDLRAKLEGAEWALELILPLAKGYAPEGQTDAAKRKCREWVLHAEATLVSIRALKEQEKKT